MKDTHTITSAFGKFLALIVISTVVIFGLMYLYTDPFNHIEFSETGTSVGIYTGATIAIFMVVFALGMYRNRLVNIGIFIGSTLILVGAFVFVQTQDDSHHRSWINAMSPRHAMAFDSNDHASGHIVPAAARVQGHSGLPRGEANDLEAFKDGLDANGLVKAAFSTPLAIPLLPI